VNLDLNELGLAHAAFTKGVDSEARSALSHATRCLINDGAAELPVRHR
jgi:hypothetical protein